MERERSQRTTTRTEFEETVTLDREELCALLGVTGGKIELTFLEGGGECIELDKSGLLQITFVLSSTITEDQDE